MGGRVVADHYLNGISVTPDDNVILAPTRGLYIGGTGDLTVDFVNGEEDVVITAPVIGTIIPISVVKVKAATTATLIVALY